MLRRGNATSRGTDLQGHEVVRERDRQRHAHQEDHRGAVHREQRVVLRRSEHRAIRSRELQPDQQRLDSTDHEEGEGGPSVEDTDLLVIDCREPAREPRRRLRTPQRQSGPLRLQDCIRGCRHSDLQAEPCRAGNSVKRQSWDQYLLLPHVVLRTLHSGDRRPPRRWWVRSDVAPRLTGRRVRDSFPRARSAEEEG